MNNFNIILLTAVQSKQKLGYFNTLLADIYFAVTSYQADVHDNLMPRLTMLIILGGCLTR